jgi:uncharacterized protein (DUF1330 family)
MPKGYIVCREAIFDIEQHAADVPLAPGAMTAHGGVILSRRGAHEVLEEHARGPNALVEITSFDAAKAYFHLTEYTCAYAPRKRTARMWRLLQWKVSGLRSDALVLERRA